MSFAGLDIGVKYSYTFSQVFLGGTIFLVILSTVSILLSSPSSSKGSATSAITTTTLAPSRINQTTAKIVQKSVATPTPFLEQGFVTHSNKSLTIVYPSTWSLETDELGNLGFLGESEMMYIFWSEMENDVSIFLDDSKAIKDVVEKMTDDLEKELKKTIESPGKTDILSFKAINRSSIGGYDIVGRKAYVASAVSPNIPTGFANVIAISGAICGTKRICGFIYERMGVNPINENDWLLVEKVISSIQFVGQKSSQR